MDGGKPDYSEITNKKIQPHLIEVPFIVNKLIKLKYL